MHSRRRLIIGAALALTAVFALPTIPAGGAPKPPPTVTVTYTDVSMGEVDVTTHVTGVNASGVIVGYFGTAYEVEGQNYEKDHHGFIKSGETATQVDVAGATDTFVRSINDTGTVVGSYTQDGNEFAFMRVGTEITTLTDPNLVTTVADSYGTVATGINSAGVIVGYSYTVGPDLFSYPPDPDTGVINTDPITRNRGFVRSPAGGFTTYDAPKAASTGGPHVGTKLFGLNDVGSMVGTYTYLTTSHGGSYPMDAAFVVSGKKFTRLINPTVEGVEGSCAWHEAAGINDAGGMGGTWGTGIGGVRGFTATTS